MAKKAATIKLIVSARTPTHDEYRIMIAGIASRGVRTMKTVSTHGLAIHPRDALGAITGAGFGGAEGGTETADITKLRNRPFLTRASALSMLEYGVHRMSRMALAHGSTTDVSIAIAKSFPGRFCSV